MSSEKQKINFKAVLRGSYILPFAVAYGLSIPAMACSDMVVGSQLELELPLLSKLQIDQILPHSDIMLLVDRVIRIDQKVEGKLSKGDKIIAEWDVSKDSPFVKGHFKENPIVPGITMIEAVAQAGGVMALLNIGNIGDRFPQLVGLGKTRFTAKVKPQDDEIIRLRLESTFVRSKLDVYVFDGVVYMPNGEIAAKVNGVTAALDEL